MRRPLLPLAAAGALALAACVAFAADDMAGMRMKGDAGVPSTKSYQSDMHVMHSAMDITYTGDADVDFAAGMIPHHEGAIAMAKTELKYGRDPEMRKLAKDIIAAQEKEIAGMQQWLAAHPAK
ncbi:MAG: DUF305 domain-containing protein [Alphaproteobacteria bacterium]